MAAAAAAFPAWADTPLPQRIQVMFRFKQLLDQHLDELTILLATEMGKVLAEARGDVLKAIEVVECACATALPDAGRHLHERLAAATTPSPTASRWACSSASPRTTSRP